jgi:hypothetical protein
VTTSPEHGTTVRLLGMRASSVEGFEAACRDWIAKARQRHAHEVRACNDGQA